LKQLIVIDKKSLKILNNACKAGSGGLFVAPLLGIVLNQMSWDSATICICLAILIAVFGVECEDALEKFEDK